MQLNKEEILINIKNLKKYFFIKKGLLTQRQVIKAVDDVSFFIRKGETFGLVGESGCGKTTLGKTILRLCEPMKGEVFFLGKNIFQLNSIEMKIKRREMQMIFQDPYSSLNPRMMVGDIIGEPLDIHNIAKGKERVDRICHLLEMVGLQKEHFNRFPHEFSVGQRQRIGIARALALEPKFIVCDEPISALDVSIQAQIINMLKDIQKKMRLTYLFIAHDLAVVKHISNRIAVMYSGKIVELAEANELYINPLHPYTKALLTAIRYPNEDIFNGIKQKLLKTDVIDTMNPPTGCNFRARCFRARPICAEKEPELKEIYLGHFVACHFPNY